MVKRAGPETRSASGVTATSCHELKIPVFQEREPKGKAIRAASGRFRSLGCHAPRWSGNTAETIGKSVGLGYLSNSIMAFSTPHLGINKGKAFGAEMSPSAS